MCVRIGKVSKGPAVRATSKGDAVALTCAFMQVVDIGIQREEKMKHDCQGAEQRGVGWKGVHVEQATPAPLHLP